MPDVPSDQLDYLMRRNEKQRKWFYARQPQAIGKILSQVMIQNRYACSDTNASLAEAWRQIVGDAFAKRTQPTGIKRGNFEVTVAHSAISQELGYDQIRIVRELQQAFPETKITGVRYRVGTIG